MSDEIRNKLQTLQLRKVVLDHGHYNASHHMIIYYHKPKMHAHVNTLIILFITDVVTLFNDGILNPTIN